MNEKLLAAINSFMVIAEGYMNDPLWVAVSKPALVAAVSAVASVGAVYSETKDREIIVCLAKMAGVAECPCALAGCPLRTSMRHIEKLCLDILEAERAN